MLRLWLENACSRPFFFGGGEVGAHSPKNVTHRPNPKKDRPWTEPGHLSHKAWISAARFELGVWIRKKDSTVQDRTGQEKSHNLGRSPHWSDVHQKLSSRWPCRRNHVCQVSKWNFQGLRFCRGRIFHFPIIFCAACDTLYDYLDRQQNLLLTVATVVVGKRFTTTSMRYDIAGRRLKCSVTLAGQHFYRLTNAIFATVARLAFETVTLQLRKHRWMSILIHGLECFSLPKADLKSLDISVTRFLMKLFTSVNIDVIGHYYR